MAIKLQLKHFTSYIIYSKSLMQTASCCYNNNYNHNVCIVFQRSIIV